MPFDAFLETPSSVLAPLPSRSPATEDKSFGPEAPSHDQLPRPSPPPARFLLSDFSGTAKSTASSWFSPFRPERYLTLYCPFLSKNLIIHGTLPYASCKHFKMSLIIMFPVTQLLMMLYFKWTSFPQMNQKVHIFTYEPRGTGYQFSGRNN